MPPVSFNGNDGTSDSYGNDQPGMDRRQFGRLVVNAGAGALLASQTAMSAGADSALAVQAVNAENRTARFSVDSTGAFSAITVGGRTLNLS
jgi:hypothetical protein